LILQSCTSISSANPSVHAAHGHLARARWLTENGYRISCATAPTLSFGLLPNWQRPSRGGSRQTPFFCPVPATAATEIVPLPFTEAQAQHPPEIDQPRLDFAVSPGKMAVNCGDVWGWGLTLRPEYYRQNARDCLRLANTTSDPRSKVMLIDMALAWRGLADRAASIRRQSYPTVASDQSRARLHT